MSETSLDHLESLFTRALSLRGRDRIAFIDEKCGGNEKMKRELFALLSAHESNDDFMRVPSDARPGADDGRSLTGVRVGPYTIRRKIASGGMGVVYEAQQEHPRRLVALKVMRAGFLSPSIRRRFRQEVEILGRLHHPGIAAIYGAGIVEDDASPLADAPYFAMELVEGRPLIAYADNANLNRPGRLRLFCEICQAVQYAHDRGVIHRDLKPANILVTPDGAPKILDFGVARATESDAQLTTVETRAGQIIGTVSYMSPEQFRGMTDALDARSDIYALGVMLFELLSGRLPHDLQPLSIAEAARVATEEEPPALGTIDRAFRGDIETIVGKAIEKERERRYESALALADDIRRYLADEPIVARAPSTIYQVRKFARRNKALVGGVVTAFFLLIAAVGGTAYGLIQATRERESALAAAREAQAISEFLDNMLSSVDPSKSGYQVTVSEVLDRASKDLDTQFKDQPAIRASLLLTIGNAYRNLGLYQQARASVRAAVDLRRRTFGSKNLNTLDALAQLAVTRVRPEESERLMSEAVAGYEALLGKEDPRTIRARAALAEAMSLSAEPGEADRMTLRALDEAKRAFGIDDPGVHRLYAVRALFLVLQGRFEEADAWLKETLAVFDRNPDKEYRFTLAAQMYLAELRQRQGRYDEAIKILRSPRRTLVRILGRGHPATLTATAALVDTLIDAGHYQEAEPLARENLELARQSSAIGDDDTLTDALRLWATLLLRTGRAPEAESPALSALKHSKRARLYRRNKILDCMATVAEVEIALGRHEEALRALDDAIRQFNAEPPFDVTIKPRLQMDYGRCHLALGRFDEALTYARAADQVLGRLFEPDNPLCSRCRDLIARIEDRRSAESTAARDD